MLSPAGEISRSTDALGKKRNTSSQAHHVGIPCEHSTAMARQDRAARVAGAAAAAVCMIIVHRKELSGKLGLADGWRRAVLLMYTEVKEGGEGYPTVLHTAAAASAAAAGLGQTTPPAYLPNLHLHAVRCYVFAHPVSTNTRTHARARHSIRTNTNQHKTFS